MAGSTAGGGQAGQEGGCRPHRRQESDRIHVGISLSATALFTSTPIPQSILVVRGFMFVKNFFGPCLLDSR